MTTGKDTPKWIYHKENGTYVVRVDGVYHGRFHSLAEATAARDRAVAGAPPPPSTGHFGADNPGQGRRPRGAQNKLTKDIKEGITQGAIMHGSDGKGKDGLAGYCWWLAHRYPKAYAHLLAKLMPLQINGAVGSYIGAVNIVAVPAGHALTPDQIATHYPQLPAQPAEYVGDPPEDPRPGAEIITFGRTTHDQDGN